MSQPSTNRRSSHSTGEPFVWLTGMGLVVGLAMVAVLLSVIFWRGLSAFWPLRVARIELTAEAKKTLGTDTIIAHILGREEKRGAAMDEHGRRPTELRLQVGNKDLFGN